MQKRIAQIFGVLVTGLAVTGLMVTDRHLFGLMNVDTALDLLRVVLAVMLLYVGFAKVSAKALRSVLMVLGVLYVGMGVGGLIDSELWGLLPTGLTGFDIIFHLASGALALVAAFANNSDRSAVDA